MMEELAPAKINLALAVKGVRFDDFHEVDTVLHSIKLADSVYIDECEETVFSCNDISLPVGAGNLAYDALQLVRRYTGITRGVRVQLLKRVPAGAGLGGGSADAAAVLRGLNRFWDLQLTAAEMHWLAGRLGSDVPFCLVGGAARGRGRGDELEPLPLLPETWLVIVRPPQTIATGAAYRAYDAAEHVAWVDVTGVVNALHAGRPEMVWRRMANVFEPVMFPLFPELAEVREVLADLHVPALMSGTGSAFFGIAASPREAGRIADELHRLRPQWQVWITKTGGGTQ